MTTRDKGIEVLNRFLKEHLPPPVVDQLLLAVASALKCEGMSYCVGHLPLGYVGLGLQATASTAEFPAYVEIRTNNAEPLVMGVSAIAQHCDKVLVFAGAEYARVYATEEAEQYALDQLDENTGRSSIMAALWGDHFHMPASVEGFMQSMETIHTAERNGELPKKLENN